MTEPQLDDAVADLGQDDDLALESTESEPYSSPREQRVGCFHNGKPIATFGQDSEGCPHCGKRYDQDERASGRHGQMELLHALLRALVVAPLERGMDPLAAWRFQVLLAFRLGMLHAKTLRELAGVLGVTPGRVSQIAKSLPQEWRWLLAAYTNGRLNGQRDAESPDFAGAESTSGERQDGCD